ncbi:hypothetical protein [Clostridium botulinum]|uniref:hypothetical protein n=1 Tax=Clostridium botulinum TaxID=1491 RepID=UPI003DA5AB6D
MKKIAHTKDLGNLKNIPNEVISTLKEITTILDSEYGDTRNVDADNGGYILLIESKEDLTNLLEIGIDFNLEVYPEYVDIIKCANNEDYTNSLILCNNDFGISLIILVSIIHKKLLDELNI